MPRPPCPIFIGWVRGSRQLPSRQFSVPGALTGLPGAPRPLTASLGHPGPWPHHFGPGDHSSRCPYCLGGSSGVFQSPSQLRLRSGAPVSV